MIILFDNVDMLSFGRYINSEARRVLNANREPDDKNLQEILDAVTERDVIDWYNINISAVNNESTSNK
jgi:hypothetical protein